MTLLQSVARRLSRSASLLPKASALSLLGALSFVLLLLTSHTYAAEFTVTWDDPYNDSTEVGGYNLYYWQTDWETPASINVGKQTTYTLTGLEANKTYHIAVTAYDSNGAWESAFSNIINTNWIVFAANIGGPEYTAADGTLYQADTGFTGGSISSQTTAIAGTEDDVLYQSSRFGDFSYAIPLRNGNYVVTLQFAEVVWSVAGKRVFDVDIEGTEAISNLDLVTKVGQNTAYVVEAPVSVTDGVLNIRFRPDIGDATINAIKVMAKRPVNIPPPQRLRLLGR